MGDRTKSFEEFTSERLGKELTVAVSGNLPLTSGGTKIIDQTPAWTALGGNSHQGTLAHELAHAFGNTIQPRNDLTNWVTDRLWDVELLQEAIGIGFSPLFEEWLRAGAQRVRRTE